MNKYLAKIASVNDTHKVVHAARVILVHPDTGEFPVVSSKWAKAHQRVLPGGKLEEGETPAQAAARETLEETGISIDPAMMEVVHAEEDRSPLKSAFPHVAHVTTLKAYLPKGFDIGAYTSPEGLSLEMMNKENFLKVTPFQADHHVFSKI